MPGSISGPGAARLRVDGTRRPRRGGEQAAVAAVTHFAQGQRAACRGTGSQVWRMRLALQLRGGQGRQGPVPARLPSLLQAPATLRRLPAWSPVSGCQALTFPVWPVGQSPRDVGFKGPPATHTGPSHSLSQLPCHAPVPCTQLLPVHLSPLTMHSGSTVCLLHSVQAAVPRLVPCSPRP